MRDDKHARKMKKHYAIVEFRKRANRMNVANIESVAYLQDLGY